MRTAHSLYCLISILFALAQDALRFLLLGTRSRSALQAENIFLRKQLALYLEREVKPRRATDAIRLSMVLLSRLFAWQTALVNVKPETFLGWHRKGFRLLWRWKSRPRGRPRLAEEVQKLIRRMARENPTWGEERIAAELLLKLGIQLSARTVRRYMPPETGPGKRVPSQRWMTFVRNHAQAILACDFFVVVTASFRVLYVFVLLEVGTRRIAQFNVTAHPTADWTLQQFREVVTGEQPYRFVLHDRDSIYSSELDSALKAMNLRILKSPFQAPQANGVAERWVESCRRDLLDHIIAVNERHLKRLLSEYVRYYHDDRTHLGLAKGTPDSRMRCAARGGILSHERLGGLHHRYDRAA
jgi:putative transposase